MLQISLSGPQDPKIWNLRKVRKRIAEGRGKGLNNKEIEESSKWHARSFLRQFLSWPFAYWGLPGPWGPRYLYATTTNLSRNLRICSVPAIPHPGLPFPGDALCPLAPLNDWCTMLRSSGRKTGIASWAYENTCPKMLMVTPDVSSEELDLWGLLSLGQVIPGYCI